MKALNDIQKFYFVGIGGIGMSALARYLKMLGKEVYGYDKTKTDLTTQLKEEGIQITYKDDLNKSLANFSKENDAIVYTPAIPNSNKILSYFKEHNFDILKRAELLGEITKSTLCLAVAGTHGKTTTSAILGHLLMDCDMPVTAFLGGIAENYGSNFIFNGSEISVVEADEFDRSFLTLSPDIACITSMDADHLDIYGDSSELERSFIEFSKLLPDSNNLLFKKGLPLNGQSVGVNETADFQAENIRIKDGSYLFDLRTPNTVLPDLQFHLPGHHNLRNAVTALGMAILAGTPTRLLPKALLNFKGVQRRFTYKIKRSDLVVIDDYAHHPTELDALHQAVDEMYPDDRKLIVFQPHLFSRTRDFVDEFARSISQFDEILLLEIYPAREEPILGVTSSWLLDKIKDFKRGEEYKLPELISKEEMAHKMKNSDCKIKLLVGAGDIGAEVENITNYLRDAS